VARPEVIRRRLQKLDEYLEILQGLQCYSFESFVEDPEHYGSAERFRQLAIETLTGMGSHVIAELVLEQLIVTAISSLFSPSTAISTAR
jgi:uncharacterized protein YutE (UPF0331/DUF86 family)